MEEFRTRWLPRNWIDDIRTQMLGSRLDPKQTTFEAWAAEVQTLNIALRGTDSHIKDEQMRRHLEANIDHKLRTMARREKVSLVTEFLPWMERMTELDDERQVDRKRISDVLDEKMRITKRPYNPARSVNPNWNSFTLNNASSSSQTTTNTYPPRLTDEECCLLHEHEGCLKCRVFYAGHHADKCTVTLSGKNYKTLTAQDAI